MRMPSGAPAQDRNNLPFDFIHPFYTFRHKK